MSTMNLKDFKKSFPAVEKLNRADCQKALTMFNDLSEGGMADDKAIELAVKHAGTANAELKDRLHFTSIVKLAEDDSTVIDIEVLRTGTLQDRGLVITEGMLADYVQHFKDNVVGCELQLNIGHYREGEAAGWFKDLYVTDSQVKGEKSLMGTVELTDLGVEKLKSKRFKFVSSELAWNFPHHLNGDLYSNVFIGAGLTNIPALKQQQPIALSELEALNSKRSSAMLKKYIESLKAREKLSQEDATLVRSLLNESSDEDKAALEPEVAEIEKRQADEAEAAKAAADAAAAAEPAKPAEGGDEGKAPEALSEKTQTVSLAEHLAMKTELELFKTEKSVRAELELSETVKVGFLSEDTAEVAAFMAPLSQAQRETFKALVGKVRKADLSTKGSTTVPAPVTNTATLSHGSEEYQTEFVALSAKYRKEGKSNDEAIALAKADLAPRLS